MSENNKQIPNQIIHSPINQEGQEHSVEIPSIYTNSYHQEQQQQQQQQQSINQMNIQMNSASVNDKESYLTEYDRYHDHDHDEEKSVTTTVISSTTTAINSEDDEFYHRFSNFRRNLMCVIISVSSITAPMTTTIVYPITDALIESFGTTESTVDACLSVFLILAGVVPLAWASFSDVYGRRPVYFSSMIIFTLSCIGSILSSNMAVYFIMRCFQAIGSSAVLAIGAGSISDIFPASVRGRAMGMYFCGPLLGPSIGPIIGGILVDNFGWRSIFYFLSIIDVTLFILINIFLPETMRNPAPIFGKDGLIKCTLPCFKGFGSCFKSNKKSSSITTTTATTTASTTTTVSASATSSPMINGVVTKSFDKSEFEQQQQQQKVNSIYGIDMDNDMDMDMNMKTEIDISKMPVVIESNSPISNTKDVKVNETVKENNNYNGNNSNKMDIIENSKKMTTPGKKSFPNPLSSVKYLRFPFVTFVIVYICSIYGTVYCLTSSLPKIYSKSSTDTVYNFSSTVVGILYVGIGLGMCMGSLVGGYDSDRLIRKYVESVTKQRKKIIDFYFNYINTNTNSNSIAKTNDTSISINTNDMTTTTATTTTTTTTSAIIPTKAAKESWRPTKIPPENRLKNIYIGSLAMVIGLLVHGWSVQGGVFVAVPLFGQLMIGFGQMYTFSITSTYLIEIFPKHSASITSLNNCLRSMFAAMTTYLYSPMVKFCHGTGFPFTILAGIIGVTFFGLFYVVRQGASLRHTHDEWKSENIESTREYEEFIKQNGFDKEIVAKYFS